MATLEAIVTAVQTALAGIDVTSIPVTPPENLAEALLPALVIYAGTGSMKFETADDGTGHPAKRSMPTIFVDLHIHRSNLALNIATAMPFVDAITNALFLGFFIGRFGGTVTLMGNGSSDPIRYALVEMNWGGMKTIGWRIEMDVSAEAPIV